MNSVRLMQNSMRYIYKAMDMCMYMVLRRCLKIYRFFSFIALGTDDILT